MNHKTIETFFKNADVSWWNPEEDHDNRSWFFKKQALYVWKQLKKNIPSTKGLQALDAGCGRGIHSRLLESLGYSVTSLDINQEMLKLTQKVTSSRLIDGSLMDMPFGKAEFDVIVSIGTSMHVPSIEKMISEIHRVLRPSGIAAVSMANKLSLYVIWTTIINRGLARHQSLYRREQFTYWDFKKIVVQQGFVILDTKGFAVIPPLSLKKNWRQNVVSPIMSRLLSYPLDWCLGKYLGCGITFVLKKSESKSERA